MVLAGALFALFMTGVVLAWLAVRRPARDAARVPMPVPPMPRPGSGPDGAADDDVTETWTAADDAAARHPAGRARVSDPLAPPKGPDDDQEFLLALERAIRGNPPVS
jgi:hypothetical protein